MHGERDSFPLRPLQAPRGVAAWHGIVPCEMMEAFWSGELFLAQEMYEDAKLSYQNVVDQFPNHQRSPDSLFKIAEIYRLQGQQDKAESTYNNVIENYPDTGASQLSIKSKENLKEESNLIE